MEQAKVMYKESEITNRKFDVLKNGDIVMEETMKYVMDYRNFLSFYRLTEQGRMINENMLKEEYLENIKKEVSKINVHLKQMLPVVEKAEKITQKKYDDNTKKSFLEGVQKELGKKPAEQDKNYLYKMATAIKKEYVDYINQNLSDDERNRFISIRNEVKKKLKK